MSDSKKSIYKPRPISGFPEWLPEVRLVEQQWFDHIRRVFESYGFCSIETPSVEEIGVLEAKGEVDKEIYVLERLHKEDGDKEARLALHFDQTVPLARYVAQNFNELVFPFKRYQMQRVWRGERPQAGRFREFYQCDIDVINIDALPLHFDAEMPAIIWEILTALPGMENEKIRMRISNRKIMIGLIQSIGIADVAMVTRIVDKLEKIGRAGVEKALQDSGVDTASINSILSLATATDLNAIKPQGALMEEGLKELSFVMDQLKHLPAGAAIADLSIIRGLDYYTGTVYETVFLDDPGYGSICSGGRYDDLASGYINKKLPGVGISIGFSRLFERMRLQNKLPVSAKSPADILMILPSEERRPQAAEAAQALRHRGLKVELYHAPKKIPDQMKYASRKGIPFVWFPPFDETGKHEVKDMTTGEQAEANPAEWKKP
jgi:histidyl-tRNA synthetase